MTCPVCNHDRQSRLECDSDGHRDCWHVHVSCDCVDIDELVPAVADDFDFEGAEALATEKWESYTERLACSYGHEGNLEAAE
jgi:hypothetical protein